MAPASARGDALALGLSLGAAATSAYVLWKTTQEPKKAPTDKKLEKKLKQQARSRKIESLIMERGQAGARAAPKPPSTPSTRTVFTPSTLNTTQAPRTTASTSSPRARRT